MVVERLFEANYVITLMRGKQPYLIEGVIPIFIFDPGHSNLHGKSGTFLMA